MKKLYIALALMFSAVPASAQMIDTIGALGIQGQLTGEAFQGINQMQGALGRINFQQDLSTLLMTVQTSMMGRYNGISKDTIGFSGFQGMDWDIGPDSSNGFYVEFRNLDAATCMTCKSREWNYRHIDINNGTDCSGNNTVRMYF